MINWFWTLSDGYLQILFSSERRTLNFFLRKIPSKRTVRFLIFISTEMSFLFSFPYRLVCFLFYLVSFIYLRGTHIWIQHTHTNTQSRQNTFISFYLMLCTLDEFISWKKTMKRNYQCFHFLCLFLSFFFFFFSLSICFSCPGKLFKDTYQYRSWI